MMSKHDEIMRVATVIVEQYEQAEQERGRPYAETFESPSTRKIQENGVTVNVRLLNKLRAAIKGAA